MEKKEELKKNIINVHQRLGTDTCITAEEMDTQRLNTITYDYLCRLEEAKNWIGEITVLPESFEEFEEEMRKGVFLAEVAKHYSPVSVGSIFIDNTLQYRHTDNINFFLKSLKDIGLPKYFYFEVIDLYEKKNFPKVVYCIHALAHYLRDKGMTGGIVSAAGKIFKSEDIERMDSELLNVKMPRFDNIQKDIASHKDSDEEEDLEVVKNKIRTELLEEENLIIENIQRDEEQSKNINLSFNDKICLKFKSFLYAKAFDDIYYHTNVSVYDIRKFMFIFFRKSQEMVKEKSIDDFHTKINDKLKEIYRKEVYLEDIESRIRLMIKNKLDLYKITYKKSVDENFNLKPIQSLLQYLQTNPDVLSNLLFKVEDKENFISTVILPLFNNVYGKKEEFLFIKLVMEVHLQYRLSNIENVDMSLQTFNDVSYRMMVNYFRISKEGEYFKQALFSIVKNLENVEIECNPTEIYKQLFNTVKSLDEALENKRVMELYQTRLSVLRGVLKSIFDFIQNNVNNIPFILRYYLKETGTEFFLKDFIYPFILAGDVFDSRFKISSAVRNKAYKLINLISWFISKFSAENDINVISEDMTVYLPIYDFLKETCNKYCNTLELITKVQSLEYYFQLESLDELVRVQKSMIYLPVRVVNGIISVVFENQDLFTSDLLADLESISEDENVILTFSFLNSDWVNQVDGRELAVDNYIKKTKKNLLVLIKICKGRNVLELILGNTTEEERMLYEQEVQMLNVPSENYIEFDNIEDLKDGLREDLKFLEEKGIVSKSNLYSEILGLLAQDIISLRFFSLERSRELKLNELTYNNLLTKEDYLDAKIIEYDDYIDSYCSRMAIKKVRYDSNSLIVKLSKESIYGSYCFTATELLKRKVLDQMFEIPDLRDVYFIITSDKPLMFGLEVYINDLLISSPYNFRFEDVLALKKFKNNSFAIPDICSFNTENFIQLLNEKYLISN